MAIVYAKVLELPNTKKVGTKECAALIRHFAPAVGPSTAWKEGEAVFGNKDIAAGTAIATFVNGRYPSLKRGNHTAFFVSQAVDGFWVLAQWRDDAKKLSRNDSFEPRHSAGPMDGPPSDLAVLKEAAKTQRIGKATVTRGDLSGTFASGKWMACNYGYSDEFILSRKLDPQTSECIVSSTGRDTGRSRSIFAVDAEH